MSKNPSPHSGLQMIEAERRRQIDSEGYSEAHDDGHTEGQMLDAAICYVGVAQNGVRFLGPPVEWPWAESDWKPDADTIRNLAKAGALIAAEIDRLERMRAKAQAEAEKVKKPKPATPPKSPKKT